MSTKKRSLFQRLAGNLRFDDIEDDVDEEFKNTQVHTKVMSPIYKDKSPEPHRELSINKRDDELVLPKDAVLKDEEEIGELPVDVYETPHELIIQTLIAGVVPENLSINITRDSITISGRREENKTILKDHFHIQELYWGAFTRSVELPAEVEIDAAEAIERHGMLMIKLPKLDKTRKTTLKIKSI